MTGTETIVRIPVQGFHLEGTLAVPPRARGMVVFAHGSGSSRLSPRNASVARTLNAEGFGTLLFDLLTGQEDAVYENRFDIPLLAGRLEAATAWVRGQAEASALPVGYFGASTGAAAALIAAADLDGSIRAVVSRGGRPDLAGEALRRVTAPVLLVVGGYDPAVIQLNRQAYRLVTAPKEIHIVPGATHLFEEPGTLEEVARQAAEWFARYLPS
ncbi:MAG TPA: alpha/beta family hydrolase [Coriobacteriia bacterium]|jgi:dienelactone hydrolase